MVDDYEPHALKKRGMSFTQNAVNFKSGELLCLCRRILKEPMQTGTKRAFFTQAKQGVRA